MGRQRAGRFGRGLAAAAVTCGLLFTAACGSGGDSNGSGGGGVAASARADQDKAVFLALQDPGTMDYVKNNLTALVLWLPGNVVEPLVTFDEDGEAQPAVAESWEINEDQTEYTFTIREASFSNGEPVTADDVVYSLTAMQESPITTYAAPFAAVSSIKATGDREVTVTLSRPSQSFFRGMGGMSGLIQPEASAGSIATKPIGTGPYVLDAYKPNSGLTFSLNKEYWGEEPSLKEVEVKIVPDGTAALNAMRAGEADAMPVITIDLWERLTTQGFDKDFEMVTYPQNGEMLYVAMNSQRPPLDDVEVRRALAQSFDRQQFIDAFNAPWGATATCGYGLSDDPQFTEEGEECPSPFDPDAAKTALQEAGYGGEPLEFASLSDVPDLSLPADLLIPQLEGVGANIERNALELARYSQLIFQGRPPEFDVTVMSDPAPITQFACTDQAKAGWTTYCNPEMTELMEQADAALTTEEHDDLMAQANQALMDDAVIVGLLAKDGVGLIHPDLKGWQEPKIHIDINFANFSW
ncbi:ABC transporter substrate-binding protein [Nocardioides sp. zg-579]|uniref:ABC transporter substrate-binding protein n=1 Tax=Nocardioides marmotae TaxID=2663857 RepID=A0A6I3JAG7_9ACTN|nr:ABC transporter substrate-binding protein [Nocardioides marmotae]MCR6030731.1 ABC transporter substrate-binding protein [Gordonia jinghuaiqii]MTB94365.1 ABC transporter substrate-binding protein [Nocardioides marmotae]QKE01608.1 ABC transporter substrate-binding protein [Nocardioides marmotae]